MVFTSDRSSSTCLATPVHAYLVYLMTLQDDRDRTERSRTVQERTDTVELVKTRFENEVRSYCKTRTNLKVVKLG